MAPHSGLLGSTVDTCSHVSLGGRSFSYRGFLRECGPRLFAWKSGHFASPSLLAAWCWCLGCPRSTGLLGGDFRKIYSRIQRSWLGSTVDACTCVSLGGLWPLIVRCLRRLRSTTNSGFKAVSLWIRVHASVYGALVLNFTHLLR